MHRLYTWYSERDSSPLTALVPARPSAVFTFDSMPFTPYQLIVVARGGQFVMFMDDNDPGSIPVQQNLGVVAVAPGAVFQRVADTLRWFVDQQIRQGNHKRANWYEGKLVDVMTALRQDTSHIIAESEARDLEQSIVRAQDDPMSGVVWTLTRHADRLIQADDFDNAARARYWAGRAAELAIEQGDTRYTLAEDVTSPFLEVLDMIALGAEVDFEADLRRRLALYGEDDL